MGAVLSFVRERERIFLRWLSEVERLLDRLVDPDHAFKAWSEGYSAAEYAAEIAPKRLPPKMLRLHGHLLGMREIRPSHGTVPLPAAAAVPVCPARRATAAIRQTSRPISP